MLDDDVVASNVVNSGALEVKNLHTISGAFTQGAGSSLTFDVTNATTYGALSIFGDASIGGSSIVLGGTLAGGESFTLVSTNGAFDFSSIHASAGIFSVTASSINSGGFEDLILQLAFNCTTVTSNTTFSSPLGCAVWNAA